MVVGVSVVGDVDVGGTGWAAGDGGVEGAAVAAGGMPTGRRRGAGNRTCSMLGEHDGVVFVEGNGSTR